jgi:hypothetical protein
MPWRRLSLMELLPEARMTVPDFWTICAQFVSHPVLHLDKSWRCYHWLSQTSFFLEKKHNGFGVAVRACDMKLFLLACVSGFMAKRLLNDSICDTRSVWCLKFRHYLIATQDSQSTTVDTRGNAVTVLKNEMSKGAGSQLNCMSQML